jgi:hypothetical protein
MCSEGRASLVGKEVNLSKGYPPALVGPERLGLDLSYAGVEVRCAIHKD